MKMSRISRTFPVVFLFALGSAFGQWSMLDEVAVIDPSLTASMVWEEDSGAVCTSSPQNLETLDFLTCNSLSDVDLAQWIGFDANGDRYGVTREQVPHGEDYTIRRRRRGTRSDDIVVRILHYRDDSVRLKSVGASKTWHIDSLNGEMILDVTGYCGATTCGAETWRAGAIKISGLPTLLDIFLSYQPPSTLSFNVPVRPEGLVGADSFSVYAGDVRTASDLSQATPIECTVPAGRPPIPGEHLTVLDALPDPALGDARYYVAAVNHQGQRRAGRTSMNGVMQGRDAAALPACP